MLRKYNCYNVLWGIIKLYTWAATTHDKDRKHKVDWLKFWTILFLCSNAVLNWELVFFVFTSSPGVGSVVGLVESWPRATSMLTPSYMNMMPRQKWSTLKNYRMLNATTSGLVSFHSLYSTSLGGGWPLLFCCCLWLLLLGRMRHVIRGVFDETDHLFLQSRVCLMLGPPH